jgi:thioredoxin-like negative regulator of GroEL
MAEIRRVRRKRRGSSRRRLKSFPGLLRQSTPPQLALLIAITALAFILGTIFSRYTSEVYNTWRQRRLLQRANVLVGQADSNAITAAARQTNLDEAMKIAKQILRIQPNSLPAFYLLAEAAEKRNLEEAVSWRAQIARLLPDDLDSQLNLASAALRFGRLDVARKALDHVPASQRDRAAFHVVAGWLARAEGNYAEQEQQFAAAVKKEPENDLYQFNLTALQIRSPDPEKNANARATLERLSKTSAFRTGALRALLNDAVARNDFGAADDLAQQLQMAPQVAFSDYLLCLNFYRKLDEKKFDALLEKVKPVAAHNPSDLALLMDWMNTNGLAGEVLKWNDKLPVEVSTQPPVAIAVAEAFANLKNWSRLKRWTRAGSWKDADYLRLAYQALGARESRQATADAEFASLWRMAERDAEEQPDRQIKLARLATKWNFSVEADALWSRVSKNPATRREALDALYRIYLGNNELKKLYDVLQQLHQSSPNETAITANLARLGLALDENAAEAHRLAKEAYDRAPDDVNCAVTYAFSLYGLGRTHEGLDILRKLPPDQLHDPHAAVYVAALLLDENQSEAAKEFIEAADRGPIYLEERRLLDEAKLKFASALPSPLPVASPSPSASPVPRSTSPPPPPATTRTSSPITTEGAALSSLRARP